MAQQHEYRVGLVGYRRGRSLAQFWQQVPGARFVAVADLVPDLLDEARKEFSEIICYPDHVSMLKDANLDILTIATSGEYHAAITRDAVAHGIRGIYCEKPMACSLADADAMIADCRAGGTVLVIGHQRRWMDQIRQVRTAIQEGAIGRPTHGYMYWATGRVGSNGTHFFDAVNFILDSTPVEVVGKLQRGLDLTKVEDHPVYSQRMMEDPGLMGFITYDNGFRLGVDCMNDVLLPYTYMFCGTRGRIDLYEWSWKADYQARDADVRSHRHAWNDLTRRELEIPAYVNGEAEKIGYNELISCIESGARPTSSGEDGRLALEMIVAVHLSHDAGTQAVTLPLPESARDYQLKIR